MRTVAYFTKDVHPCLAKLSLKFNGVLVDTLRPRQNGLLFPDDIFKCIFFNQNVWISLKSSLKFVPKVRFNNIPALVPIMVWCRPGDKPLSEPIMVSLLMHICVNRPQWVQFWLISLVKCATGNLNCSESNQFSDTGPYYSLACLVCVQATRPLFVASYSSVMWVPPINRKLYMKAGWCRPTMAAAKLTMDISPVCFF